MAGDMAKVAGRFLKQSVYWESLSMVFQGNVKLPSKTGKGPKSKGLCKMLRLRWSKVPLTTSDAGNCATRKPVLETMASNPNRVRTDRKEVRIAQFEITHYVVGDTGHGIIISRRTGLTEL